MIITLFVLFVIPLKMIMKESLQTSGVDMHTNEKNQQRYKENARVGLATIASSGICNIVITIGANLSQERLIFVIRAS